MHTMTDYKDRYLTNLDQSLERIEKKVDSNITITRRISDKVLALEIWKEMQDNKTKVNPNKIHAWYKDPKVVQIFLYISIAFLMLVAAVTKFDFRTFL